MRERAAGEGLRGDSRARALAALALAALASASVALAGGGAIADPKGDSRRGAPDIRSASLSQGDDRLTYTVRAYRRFATVYGAPCVQVLAGTGGRAYYVACAGPRVRTAAGRATGRVRVSRPDARTIGLSLSPAAIGDPAVLRWRALVLRSGRQLDRAPDRDFARHVLKPFRAPTEAEETALRAAFREHRPRTAFAIYRIRISTSDEGWAALCSANPAGEEEYDAYRERPDGSWEFFGTLEEGGAPGIPAAVNRDLRAACV